MTSFDWSVLYRGPLSSCNYACSYCPFGKTQNTRAELAEDAAKLDSFVEWAIGRPESMGILFTPWGEALIRKHYQQAFVRLSHAPNIKRVVAQTNLSFQQSWLDGCNLDAVRLWTTFHPSQTTIDDFLERCHGLLDRGVQFSVGVVGLHEHLVLAQELRAALPDRVYVWVNAYKREADYYSQTDIQAFQSIDPNFRYNLLRHPSLGRKCRAGSTAFTVDGDGIARRCHFIDTPLGSIYEPGFAQRLAPTPCTNVNCGCHIGYVHMPELELYELFGDGVLERIPAEYC